MFQTFDKEKEKEIVEIMCLFMSSNALSVCVWGVCKRERERERERERNTYFDKLTITTILNLGFKCSPS
jgi:hypothetical protein